MRFAYVLGTHPQPSETFIRREIDGLHARGHQVDIFSLFAPVPGREAVVRYGWANPVQRIWRKAASKPALSMLAKQWHREFTAGRYAAVVAHFASLPSTVALRAAGTIPLIVSLHARDLYVEAEFLPEKLSRAQAVVTCTQANVDYLRMTFPASAAKMHLVYHGLPQSWLDAPMPERTRQPGEPLRLLAIGRMVEKKGFAVLIDACHRLARHDIAFELRIIGDGPLHDDVLRQINALSLRTSVSLDPWLDEPAVRAAYAWADVFCCPSIIANDGDRDGLPNVLIEAMSTGLPVVASRISGIPEAVEDGTTGLLVPPGDVAALTAGISRLIHPVTRTEFGARARDVVHQRYAGTSWLDKLESVLCHGNG
ncbi:MAG TPA: glycosyltransferase family 4 protein [Armatimonadota bacterium]|nr:glycosyltransferase family 4 protein [Armatimonadota bacterium]